MIEPRTSERQVLARAIVRHDMKTALERFGTVGNANNGPN